MDRRVGWLLDDFSATKSLRRKESQRGMEEC